MIFQLSFRKLGIMAAVLAGLAAPLQTLQAQDTAPLNDAEVLAKASEQPVDRLLELLGAYERLGKKAITRQLADEILKKDPTNAQALRVKEGRPMTSLEPSDAGSPPSEADLFDDKIDALRRRGAYGTMARTLAARKRSQGGGAFKYQEDLADAYQQSGNTSAAKAAYRELSGTGYSARERSAARQALVGIEKAEMYSTATAALKKKDTASAMQAVEKLLKRYPSDKDGLVMKAIVLSESGDTDAALALMDDLRAKHRGGKFPYAVDHAGIHLAAKNYDEAEAMYKEMGGAAGKGGLRELDRARSVDAAYTAIRRGRGEGALAIADELAVAWPKDPDVATLRGEALLAAGRPGEAAAELAAVKAEYYSDGPFPSQGDLAFAYYKVSDLEAASAAYEEILTGDYSASQREDAIIQSRSIRGELGAGLNVDLQVVSEEEGDVNRASVYGHTALKNGWRFWGWSNIDSIDLKESALRAESAERYEAGVAIEHRGGDWNKSLLLGASEDDIIAGGRLSRNSSIGTWYLEGAYNERADDSLSLQALDGRQHRFEAGLYAQITPRINLDTAAYVRWVEMDGESLGNGWGFLANLDYTIVEGLKRRPAVRVGYAGEVHVFDADSVGSAIDNKLLPGLTAAERAEFLGDLVEEEINLHGIRGQIEGRINPDLSYYVMGAIQYDTFDKELQYSAGVGIEKFFNDNVRLVLGVEYYSAGQGASSSEGVVVGNAGISVRF